MCSAASTTKGGISAPQHGKSTSEELLNRAGMKGLGRAESLLQWDIRRDNKQKQNTTRVNELTGTLATQTHTCTGCVSYRAVEHALAIHADV